MVANALRLLKLPSEVQAHLREGRLSVGHAKVILGLNGAEEQKLAAERVLKKSLNVRQTDFSAAAEQVTSGLATGFPAGAQFGPSGFIVNCPVVSLDVNPGG